MTTDKLLKNILERVNFPGTEITYKRDFFKQTGIGHKRWGQLLRSEKHPTDEEIEKLCTVFKIDKTALLMDFLQSVKEHQS